MDEGCGPSSDAAEPPISLTLNDKVLANRITTSVSVHIYPSLVTLSRVSRI